VYLGRSYELAQGRDCFVIVHHGAPWWRRPLYAFPNDASGWELAWREFCRIEPHHAAVSKRTRRRPKATANT
jgi:hypothetical protein